MRTDLPYIAHNDHTCGGNREKRSQAFAPLPAPAFDPSGPPWSLCGYSSLDRCPRCDQCMAVPDPGWAEPACTIAGCGQGTAEPSLDPTANRSSLEARHLGFEQWLAELCEGISARGHLVDIGALCEAQDRAEGDLEKLSTELAESGVENPNDNAQVREALEKAGCRFDRRFVTKDGSPSTHKVALGFHTRDTLAEDLAESVVAYRTAKTRHDQLRAIDRAIDLGRVHPHINPSSCESGRMSTKAPNLMGLVSDLRHVLLAKNRHVLVKADFATLEWRVAAALSGDELLRGRITEGVDLHSALAAELFGPDFTAEDRQLAKKLSFEALYGAGVSGMVESTGISASEARRIRNGIWEAYPELGKLARGMRDVAEIPTPYGRTIATSEAKPHARLNYLIQATARDLLVDALCWLAHTGWADNVWMLLHDEVILSVPHDATESALRDLSKAMNLHLLGVPITAEAKVLGHRWE